MQRYFMKEDTATAIQNNSVHEACVIPFLKLIQTIQYYSVLKSDELQRHEKSWKET